MPVFFKQLKETRCDIPILLSNAVGLRWKQWGVRGSDSDAYKGYIVLLMTLFKLLSPYVDGCKVKKVLKESCKRGYDGVWWSVRRAKTWIYQIKNKPWYFIAISFLLAHRIMLIFDIFFELKFYDVNDICWPSYSDQDSIPSDTMSLTDVFGPVHISFMLPSISTALSLSVKCHLEKCHDQVISNVGDSWKRLRKTVYVWRIIAQIYLKLLVCCLKWYLRSWFLTVCKHCNWKTTKRISNYISSLLFSNRKRVGVSEVFMIVFVHQMLLMMAGDVERNPGPGQRVKMSELFFMKSSNGHIRVIEESCYQWRYIGIHLNLTSSHLSSIDAENGHNITRAMRDVYSTWMERDIDSSWQKLIKCFKRVELHRLARRLEQHIVDVQVQRMLKREGKFMQKDKVVIITGLMGAGKTTLLHKLFGILPPENYTSTPPVGWCWRSTAQFTLNEKLKRVEKKEILKLLSQVRKTMDDGYNSSDDEFDSEEEQGDNFSSDKSEALETYTEMVQTNQDEGTLYGELEFVHVIDTGGQPECLEVMPSLVHHSHLILLLIDLSIPLNDRTMPTLTINGKPLPKQPLCTSNKQLIEQLAHTMAGRENAKVLVIGSHKDKPSETVLKERKTQFNAFIESILPIESLLLNGSDYIFDMDVRKPDSESLKHIQENIIQLGKVKAVPLPTSFVLFENDLLPSNESTEEESGGEGSTEEGREEEMKVLTLSDCISVGRNITLKMTEEVVVQALEYFDENNIILFFKDVGPGLIFTPRSLNSLLNKIIHFAYRAIEGNLDEGKPIVPFLDGKTVKSLRNGVISLELLNHPHLRPNFVSGVFKVEHAVEILKSLYIVVDINPPSSDLIMMCLLPNLPEDKLQTEFHALIETTCEIDPLLINFGTEKSPPLTTLTCSPCGSFGKTIAILLSKNSENWRIRQNRQKNVSRTEPERLYHQIITLDYSRHIPVTFVNMTKYLEVYVKIKELNDCKRLPEIREEVVGAVKEALRKINVTSISVAEGLECTCGEIGIFHTKYLMENNMIQCDYTRSRKTDNVWVTGALQNIPEDDQTKLVCMDDLKELTTSKRKIEILKECTEKYMEIGKELLQESIVDSMKDKVGGEYPDTVIRMVFARWIREDKNHSWSKLVDCFNHVQFTTLASDIAQHFGVNQQDQDNQTDVGVSTSTDSLGAAIAGDDTLTPASEENDDSRPEKLTDDQKRINNILKDRRRVFLRELYIELANKGFVKRDYVSDYDLRSYYVSKQIVENKLVSMEDLEKAVKEVKEQKEKEEKEKQQKSPNTAYPATPGPDIPPPKEPNVSKRHSNKCELQ